MQRAKGTLASHKTADDLLARENLTAKRLKAKKRRRGDRDDDDEKEVVLGNSDEAASDGESYGSEQE